MKEKKSMKKNIKGRRLILYNIIVQNIIRDRKYLIVVVADFLFVVLTA